MQLFRGTKKNYVGIDIKKNVVRFVELRSLSPLVVKSYGERAIHGGVIKNGKLRNEELLYETLIDLANSRHLKNKGIIYTAFNQNVVIKQAVVNGLVGRKEIEEYLFLELGDSIPLPFEDPIFDILSSEEMPNKRKKNKKKEKKRDKEGKTSTFSYVATPEETLNIVAETMKKSKLVPVAVDISSLAYQRVISKRKSRRSLRDSYLLLEVDCGVATFTIFEKNVPIYTQYEEYNPNHWSPIPETAEEVEWILGREVKNVEWDDLEADQLRVKWTYDEKVEKDALVKLTEVIANVLYYYSSTLSDHNEIEKIIVVGDNPLLETTVKSTFKKRLDVPFEILIINGQDKNGKKIPFRYYLALGLAMKEV